MQEFVGDFAYGPSLLQTLLPGLEGRLEGGGGFHAADGAVDDGEGVQVLLQFFGGEAGIEAGQLAGEEGEAVTDAERIVFAEEALRPAEKSQAGADFLLDQGRVGGRDRRRIADALPTDGTDAGILRGGEDEGVAHAGGFGIDFEGVPKGPGAEDKGRQGRRFPVHEDGREDAVRAGPEPPCPVWFGQIPVEHVVPVMPVDAPAHPFDARFVQIHAGREEAHPFGFGDGLQAPFPEGLSGLLHRNGGNREMVLEVRDDGTHGFGAGKVHDDGAETAALLEREHGQGPVEGVQVPGRNDEGDLSHMQGFYPCKDSENALNL